VNPLNLIGPKENWKSISFPDDANKQQTVAWIIRSQDRRINKLEYQNAVLLGAFATAIIAIAIFLVTGKLHWIG
jgi:hypothetical protein